MQWLITKDGTPTVEVNNMTYHSIHGALQETEHVFIQAGLHYIATKTLTQPIRIFEMGLGTGLNAAAACHYATQHKIKVHYTAVEVNPLPSSFLQHMPFMGKEIDTFLQKINECSWDSEVAINQYFSIVKQQNSLQKTPTSLTYDCIFYDAFAPTAQPELWTKEIFNKLYQMLLPQGALVTYCSKGEVRRNMQAAGFDVQKLQGPKGKREMLRAIKPVNS